MHTGALTVVGANCNYVHVCAHWWHVWCVCSLVACTVCALIGGHVQSYDRCYVRSFVPISFLSDSYSFYPLDVAWCLVYTYQAPCTFGANSDGTYGGCWQLPSGYSNPGQQKDEIFGAIIPQRTICCCLLSKCRFPLLLLVSCKEWDTD